MSLLNSNNFIYYYIVLFGLYGMIFAPYIGSKIFAKIVKSERYWFYILVLFNIYLFIGVFFHSGFRNQLSTKERWKIILLVLGYLLIFSIVLFF